MIRFDRRIRVERKSRDKDADGNVLQVWEPLAALWANVRETPGRETLEAGRVASVHTATVWVRSGPISRGITGGDRLIYRDLAWDILGANPSGADGRIIELILQTDGRQP